MCVRVWVVAWHMGTMDGASKRIQEKSNPVAADAMEAFNLSIFILFFFFFHFCCQAQRDEFIRIQASAFYFYYLFIKGPDGILGICHDVL